MPGGGGAYRTPRCEVRPGHRARLHRDGSRPLGAADARSHPRAARRRVRVRGLPRVLRRRPPRPGADAPQAHHRRRPRRRRLRRLQPPGAGRRELLARGRRGRGVRGVEVDAGPARTGQQRRVSGVQPARSRGVDRGRSPGGAGRGARRGEEAGGIRDARGAGADHPRAHLGRPVRHILSELHRRLLGRPRPALRLRRGTCRRQRRLRRARRVEAHS